MIIAQIKGSNGSGKTTIVKQLLSHSDVISVHNEDAGCLTVAEDLGWVVVGKYSMDKAMGGCDTVSSGVEGIKSLIYGAMEYCVGRLDMYGIVFEGMMISTIKSTFYNYVLRWQPLFTPRFVILQATLEGCLERIRGRGTMKSNLNHDNIRNKCEMVIRHAMTYDPQYVRWIDVEHIPVEQMLPEFLKAVDDKVLLEALYG